MATDIAEVQAPAKFPQLPDVELIESDGEPMDTDWHRRAMNVLIESVDYRWRDREDYYVGGNMFIYFSIEHARNRDFRGPDFFFVEGVNRRPMRPYWVVWEEGGRYPDVVVELLSPTTETEDKTTKKDIYENVFRTSQLFHYDPDNKELKGWNLNGGKYQQLEPDEHGRLWCEKLELWLGIWEGTISGWRTIWLRFFDSDGKLVPLEGEAERDRADEAVQRAEDEKQRAENEKQRAENEKQRAENEKQRAEALAKELADLRNRLANDKKN